jgi:hypothetical protein
MVASACAPSPTGTVEFPIIGSDPEGLVETMEWSSDGDFPDPDSFEEPSVLATSTGNQAAIAVKGGGCPPSAQVEVSGAPESVKISILLGGAIEPEGVDCAETVTTHVLLVTFRDPINLDNLSVSAIRTGSGISEG